MDVVAGLSYLKPTSERPESPGIDREGFELRDAPTAIADFLDENAVKTIYFATHSPRHRWSYYAGMDRHEALVFKQYDSQVSGVARFTPHAAFDHPRSPPDAPLRESIELRCLVVYE